MRHVGAAWRGWRKLNEKRTFRLFFCACYSSEPYKVCDHMGALGVTHCRCLSDIKYQSVSVIFSIIQPFDIYLSYPSKSFACSYFHMHMKTHSLLFICLSVRWENSRMALWSGSPSQDLSQWDRVQRVLDWTELWYYQFWQHPICSTYCVPVHHHGGLGGHPLQRESICTKDFSWHLIFVVQCELDVFCYFSHVLHQHLQ